MNLDKTILQGKGIFVFSDPAGANAVLAIVDELILQGYVARKDFLVFTNSLQIGIEEYNDVVDVTTFNENERVDVIQNFKPTYIFSGTSLTVFEHLWRKAAIKENVKMISFIDHWTSYIERFSFNNEIIFGDEVWVVNEIAKKEAIEAGIHEELITVSGNPYYKKVKNFHPKISKEDFFNSLRLDIHKKVILFVSDDIKRSFPSDEKGNCVLGFDEYTVLSDIIIGLKTIDTDLQDFQLVLKLHPKSDVNKFKHLLSDMPQNLNVIAVKDCDSLTINYFSDYIIGMFSNMVIESCIMGKKILRVQTGQLFNDIMKFKNLRGKVVIERDDLKGGINNFLKDVHES